MCDAFTGPISCHPVFAPSDFYLRSHISILKEPYVYMKRALHHMKRDPHTTSPISCHPVFAPSDFYLMSHISILQEPHVYIKRALYLYEKRPIKPALYQVNLYSLEVIFSKHEHTQGRHVRQRLDVTQLCMYVCDVTHSNT